MVRFSHLFSFSLMARKPSILNWCYGMDGCETAGWPKTLLLTQGSAPLSRTVLTFGRQSAVLTYKLGRSLSPTPLVYCTPSENNNNNNNKPGHRGAPCGAFHCGDKEIEMSDCCRIDGLAGRWQLSEPAKGERGGWLSKRIVPDCQRVKYL